jgi:hypothetical protein
VLGAREKNWKWAEVGRMSKEHDGNINPRRLVVRILDLGKV